MVAVAIFSLTLILVIWQPRSLQIGTSAIFGAILALGFKVVSFDDVLEVTYIVWDATLSFIGIIILSMILDEIGFFEWAAIKMAKFSKGNGIFMFILILLLGAFVAAFFANDGAALILTPILLAKMRLLKMDTKAIFAFLIAGGFIGDSASNPLVISNLTNIVTANYFHIGFIEYMQTMFLPNLLSIVASIITLWLFFRKSIPLHVNIQKLPNPTSVIKNIALFRLSWWFLGILLLGYFIGDFYKLPISVFALGGALIFLFIATKYRAIKPFFIIKTAPWQVVWFSIGLYIVVFGLKNAGLTDYLTNILLHLKTYGNSIYILATGFISALLSSIMNNMPTIMIMDIAIDKTTDTFLAYANIIGSNLGPKMTPIGSLATLLWLHVLSKKGIKISFLEYMKVGFIITPPVLFVALLGLL